MTEIWTSTVVQTPDAIEKLAIRAEAAGFDGLFYSDSQNLRMELWVALAIASKVTSRLKLGSNVTNPVTRHPAVTASAAATLQETSGGRVVLGVGRGDSALAYLGYGPVSLAQFGVFLQRLQAYLRGEEVAFNPDDIAGLPGLSALGYAKVPVVSKIRWLPASQPKVPVTVVSSGPRVISQGARLADGVSFAVGADIPRLSSMLEIARAARKAAGLDPASLSLTAHLNVVVHPDRDEARRLAAGGVAMMARWSVMRNQGEAMADETVREQFLTVRSAYDMTHHGGETGTSHAAAVTAETIDRFGIAGPPDYCIERIREVMKLGFDRIVLPAPLLGGEPSRELGLKLLVEEVLPNLR